MYDYNDDGLDLDAPVRALEARVLALEEQVHSLQIRLETHDQEIDELKDALLDVSLSEVRR